MVAAVSETTNQSIRPPSQKDSDVITHKYSIRPKSTQLSSIYPNSISNSSSLRTSTPSRRSHSPLISRNLTTPVVNRSVSVDRRRLTRPDLTLNPNNAIAGATCTRSLSVSFQGEAFSLPINKTKITPQRKRIPTVDHVENTKPMDHHRWPGWIRQPNATVYCSNVIRELELHQSVNLESIRRSIDGGKCKCKCESNLDLGDSADLLKTSQQNPDGNSVKDSYSDTDSVSSGSTSGVQENGSTRERIGRNGIIVSAKFWQETNSRMRRLQDPSSPLSVIPKANAPQKSLILKRFSSDNNHLSSTRTLGSPNRMRPLSPNKFMMTSLPSRGMISSRRNSVSGNINNNASETPSVLSFAVDVRRGKVGENRFLDAHVLRLLYNRLLQWRFVNARNEDIVLKQKDSVEENLWNAWITISDLRDSVRRKRHRLQLLRQKLKLALLLKAQMAFLEDWGYLDKTHSISLVGAIEALKASTLRLPVAAGATVDLKSMKDAINSALDGMQAMVSSSSVNSLCLQVEEVNLLVTKIAKVSAKERALLRICKDFLTVLSALKVIDCSLRTHMLQTSRCC